MFRNHGLSLVMAALFLAFLAAQLLTGLHAFNAERVNEGQPTMTLREYVASGPFLSATAENWESEFLQMAAYVVMTAFLFQRGSSESSGRTAGGGRPRPAPARGATLRCALAGAPRRLGAEAVRAVAVARVPAAVPGVVRAARGGRRAGLQRGAAMHGDAPVTALQYLHGAKFWFESFQNWQSEFLAILAMVVLSIFLRQRGSPESKPVDAPHSQTGSD